MKKTLTFRETLSVTSMLFGMFFGAGNLIFPALMGQLAGRNVWIAVIGFCVTAVGLPLLGVAALGISRSDGLQSLSSKVGKGYGYFFTCALYLSIGPFFAIPRCATVPFSIGIEPLLGSGSTALALVIFTVVFFALVLFFSLFPNGIMTWIGKILNPTFLLFLGVLVTVALISPATQIKQVEPVGDYAQQPFFEGFLAGYNTMDALAGLAFGIVVVQVICGLGLEEAGDVAGSTVRAGVFSCLFMGLIYLAVTVVGAQSRGAFEPAENGGVALAQIARYYLGDAGMLVLAATVTLACLKTAVGLITSCSEAFVGMFPKGPKYRVWAIIFSGISFLFANLGLSAIIDYSLPVLMFLYPLSIVLILLALFGKFFRHDRRVYVFTIGFTFAAAIYDLLAALPESVRTLCRLDVPLEVLGKWLPMSELGLGWICPAAIGCAIGLAVMLLHQKKRSENV